jgi:hypothetical protein
MIILTLENILRTQWYLEKHNIKYFMTTYMDIFGKYNKNVFEHEEIKYLYEMIDFEKFIPINGCYEWLIKNYPDIGFDKEINKHTSHPNKKGHTLFSNELIIPFIKLIL